MLKSYLKIAYRNLLKNKVFSLINILGLAIGMAACLLILQYVSFELSYDDFHEKAANIYRIDRGLEKNGEEIKGDIYTYPGLGPAVVDDIPGVKACTRLHHAFGETVITYKKNTFREDQIFFADAPFLQMFSFSMLKGNPALALAEPNSIVLSESAAKKYFGQEDPIDKNLTVYDLLGKHNYRVTGIIQDVPANSHLSFDFLMSTHTLLEYSMYQEAWVWSNFHTYIWLEPTTDPAAVQTQLTALSSKYTAKDISRSDMQDKYYLTPLDKIHLYSRVNLADAEEQLSGEGKTIIFLAIIAAFILMIGYINYVNLSTARAMERAKEVGIRKVVGARQVQLIKQFLLDATLISSIAFALAITFVQLALPVFTHFAGKPIPALWWNQSSFWIVLLGGLALITILSGLYPAVSLSSFRPLSVLKGKFIHSSKGIILRRVLTTFQFTISIALIAGTLAVYHQLVYMQKQDLGIDIQQTLVLKAPNNMGESSDYEQKWEVFRNEVLALPAIESVTASNTVPGKGYNWTQEGIRREEADPKESGLYHMVGIDYDFVPSYQLRLLAGRNFSHEHHTDRQKVLLNETATKQLGFNSPAEAIGETIMILDNKFEVLGVVNNYHQKSLQYAYDPIIYQLNPFTQRFYSLKVDIGNLPATLSSIQSKWDQVFAENPFEYFFLDDFFNQQYRADQQLAKIFSFFAALAIFIACLGLFGLSSYTTIQRTKEIGIRKVLGASVDNIVALLSKDFIKLIFLASLIALPIVYFAIQQWLKNYAFRIEMSWWLLATPVAMVMLIALLTISLQTLRAALANPADSLRYE